MKRVLVIPDSFKGTMSSVEVCTIISSALKSREGCTVKCIPLADGGEGTVDAFLFAKSGRKIRLNTKNALGEDTVAQYAILDNGTAVIETASASGIIDVDGRNNPLSANTFGTGQQILDAVDKGCKKIILGLGGSATTDVGMGALSALGVRFFDSNGVQVKCGGGFLHDVAAIDDSGLDKRIRQCKITFACDVSNPLYGNNGTAKVFARQKGANDCDIETLEQNIVYFSKLIESKYGIDLQKIVGGGAAGGLGAGLSAVADYSFEKGIDIILRECDFDRIADNTDYIITGEGKLDRQSLSGKVPVGIAQRAQKYHIPVIVVAGTVEGDYNEFYNVGITDIYRTSKAGQSFDEIKLSCKQALFDTASEIKLR